MNGKSPFAFKDHTKNKVYQIISAIDLMFSKFNTFLIINLFKI